MLRDGGEKESDKGFRLRHTRDCGAGGGAVAGEWQRWLVCRWCGGGWEWLVEWLVVLGWVSLRRVGFSITSRVPRQGLLGRASPLVIQARLNPRT